MVNLLDFFASGAIHSSVKAGNIVVQKLSEGSKVPIAWKGWRYIGLGLGAFAAIGISYVCVGPITHYLYRWLHWVEAHLPGKDKVSQILKVIVDRLFSGLPFLLGYLYCIRRFEGKSHQTAVDDLEQAIWQALKKIWMVWTMVQYGKIN
ncbi:peroxisomal membrane protein 2-like [Patiria miniata]|uniref:Uncharacterized protein n=1 Tax=Patiria miniata TaxID=46514 RepID=A0A914BH12_PATMI|nr:peroxisomal membrane protein 2-like [Patiria miniata]